MSPRVPERPIPYATPGVRTAPRRTLPRVLVRWFWNLLRAITRWCQALLLGLGYAVLGAAILLRAVLVAVAAVLLFAGRMRWNGPAIRVWVVRSLNRAWIKASGLVRRDHNHVPLATPFNPPSATSTGGKPSLSAAVSDDCLNGRSRGINCRTS